VRFAPAQPALGGLLANKLGGWLDILEAGAVAGFLQGVAGEIRITRDWTLGSARYAEQDGLARLAG
jgi:hypothetical protein